jgi:SAM-dependent methyltransferase
VIGVDPSATMLDYARRQPGSAAVTWVLGDASVLVPTRTADLVVCTGNAVMQISAEELPVAFRSVAGALRPGGTLAFESRNPAARAWERWAPEAARGERPTPIGFLREWMEVAGAVDGRVVFEARNVFADGQDRVVTNTLFFRTAGEFRTALGAAGFRDISVYGDWRGSPLTEVSPLLVVRATLG